jgi:hypothetical protein
LLLGFHQFKLIPNILQEDSDPGTSRVLLTMHQGIVSGKFALFII